MVTLSQQHLFLQWVRAIRFWSGSAPRFRRMERLNHACGCRSSLARGCHRSLVRLAAGARSRARLLEVVATVARLLRAWLADFADAGACGACMRSSGHRGVGCRTPSAGQQGTTRVGSYSGPWYVSFHLTVGHVTVFYLRT